MWTNALCQQVQRVGQTLYGYISARLLVHWRSVWSGSQGLIYCFKHQQSGCQTIGWIPSMSRDFGWLPCSLSSSTVPRGCQTVTNCSELVFNITGVVFLTWCVIYLQYNNVTAEHSLYCLHLPATCGYMSLFSSNYPFIVDLHKVMLPFSLFLSTLLKTWLSCLNKL